MKLLKCERCKGPFSEGMNVEELNGKNYHAYCADARRKELQRSQSPTGGLWIALWSFFPWLPIR